MERFDVETFIRQVEAMPEDQRLAAVDAKRAECDRELGKIRAQIDGALSRHAATGSYSDPRWFRSAQGARRAIGWNVQRLNEYRGKLRKRLNQLHYDQERSEFLAQFYRACKEVLSPEVMAELVQKANEARPCQV